MTNLPLQVYYYLLKVYLDPPEPAVLGLPVYKNNLKPQPNLTEALRIMEDHAGSIDTVKVRINTYKQLR